MPAAPPAAPTLAGFVLDETRGALLAPDGTAAPLRPKTFALLQLLLRQRGELVGRQQILDEVWAGVTVTDDNVTQCIGEIRRALGEEGGRLLRTVPKRGYVLAAEDAVPLPPAAQRSSPWRRHPWLPLLALLLLVPLGLGVLGWGFGRHTGPQPLASLTAQASVPQAMQFYEQGRAAASRPQVQQADNWLTARAFFEQAIAADPGFAPAYAEAAFTYTNVVINGQSSDQGADLRRAEALVRRAAELAPDLAVVHTAQAAVLRLQRRPAEALEAYRRAVALEPRQFAARANSGLMLLLLGRPRESLDPVLQSLTLAPAKHPFTGTWLTYLGIAELQMGAGDFGAERLRSSLEWQAFLPLDTRRLYLAAALALQGRQDEAAGLVRQVRTRQPAISISSLRRDELSDVPAYQAQQANFYRGLSLAGLPE